MQVEDLVVRKYDYYDSNFKLDLNGFDELSNINKSNIYVIVDKLSLKNCYGYFELPQKDLDKYKDTTVKCYQINNFNMHKELVTFKGLEFLLPLLFISNSIPDTDEVYWYEKNGKIYAIEYPHNQTLLMNNLEDFINPLLSE